MVDWERVTAFVRAVFYNLFDCLMGSSKFGQG